MKITFMAIVFALCYCLFLSSCSVGAREEAAELKVGAATAGMYPTRGPEQHPLLAKAIIFQQGEEKAALVMCDQCFVLRPTVEMARKQAEEKLGIPADHIAIAGTHTHQGRDRRLYASSWLARNFSQNLGMKLPGQSQEEINKLLTKALQDQLGRELPAEALQRIATEISKELATKSAEPENASALRHDFSELLKEKLSEVIIATLSEEFSAQILQALAAAQARLQPVQFKAGTGELVGHACNRRFFMKDGSIKYNPGAMNPEIVRPAGPVDPEVGFILFSSVPENRPVASLSSFAMHVCTIEGAAAREGEEMSVYAADYPFCLQLALEKEFGKDFVSIFGQGACGDINHVDVSRNDQKGDRAETARHGEGIARVMLASLPAAEPAQQPALAVRVETIQVPLKSFTKEELEWGKHGGGSNLYNEAPRMRDTRRGNILMVEELRQQSPTQTIEVQAFRLSEDIAFVALPGELFVEIGMAIKEGSPFKYTQVITIANDWFRGDYIPTRAAIEQEVRNSYNILDSRFGPECSEMIIATSLKLLKELKETP
ncbi:MAG: hypothetical protein JXA52_09390 [Planctomycetes bacterium]|nr:hypothetical protein [Planctomycetota bacterium]